MSKLAANLVQLKENVTVGAATATPGQAGSGQSKAYLLVYQILESFSGGNAESWTPSLALVQPSWRRCLCPPIHPLSCSLSRPGDFPGLRGHGCSPNRGLEQTREPREDFHLVSQTQVNKDGDKHKLMLGPPRGSDRLVLLPQTSSIPQIQLKSKRP